MVTLKDIAEEAGVSVMTVSRVVNGQLSKVSGETTKKIQEIIQKRGYVPNSTARSLSSKSSRIIGVVIKSGREGIIKEQSSVLEDPYYSAMVGSIMNSVLDHDYYMMLHNVKHYKDISNQLQSWNAEGAILLGTFIHDIQKIKENNKIPLVFTDSYSSVRQITNVGIDDYKGGVLAAKHFIELGHEHFVFVGFDWENSYVVRHRLDGYQDTLRQAGFSLNTQAILPADDPQTADKLCAMEDRHIAVFCSADLAAVSLMDTLKRRGYSVPGKYSFIGFDNLPISNYITPGLTTVSQNIPQKAQLAIDILFQHIQDHNAPAQNVVLDVSLVERGSVLDLRE